MIQRFKPFDSDPYDRPHDDWQTFELPSTEDGSSAGTFRTSSLRFNRKKFTFAVTAFVVGLLAILMLSDARNEFIAPGPLASNHAQLLVSHGADRCAACHDAGNGSFRDWLMSAFRPGNKAQSCQSTLCMKCHSHSISTDFATAPHNVDPQIMREISGQYVDKSSAMRLHPPIDSEGAIECSACHREHHGKEDLTKMTVSQCQSCHQEQFQGFEIDHPEFAQWPQQQRQGIAFDHVSHGYRHFPGQNEEFNCQACHVDDRFQNVKLLANYEQACAKCHQKEIEGRSESGLTLVSLPMLDLDAIKNNGLSVGAWPDDASGDFDGQVSELARVLLYQDDSAREVLNKRGVAFDFSDLDAENPEDVADAVQLAWSIKYLLYDLAVGGETEVRKRLQFALARTLPDYQALQLTSGLRSEVFARAVNQWLPELATEVPQHRPTNPDQPIAQIWDAQKPLRFFQDQSAADELARNPLVELMGTAEDQSQNGTQQQNSLSALTMPQQSLDFDLSEVPFATDAAGQDDSQLSAFDPVNEPRLVANVPQQQDYQPQILESELLADNPLSSFADAARPPATRQTNAQPKQSLPANPVQQPNVANHNPAPRITVPQIDESELLAKNLLGELMASDQTEIPAQADVADANPVGRPDRSDEFAEQYQSNTPAANVDPSQILDHQIVEEFVDRVVESQATTPLEGFQLDEAAESERFVGATVRGGWFRNDQLFQINYRPSGHGDQLLTVLSDVVAATSSAKTHPAVGACFKKMTSDAAVGACNKCHTTDQGDNLSYQVNWKPKHRDPLTRSFTKFSHAPHLVQTELRDCNGCHTLDPNQSNANSFVGFDSTNCSSNFAAITRMNCVGCHREGGAENQCTECHNYHVGSRVAVGE